MSKNHHLLFCALSLTLMLGCSSNSNELAQINNCQENKTLPECLSEEQKLQQRNVLQRTPPPKIW